MNFWEKLEYRLLNTALNQRGFRITLVISSEHVVFEGHESLSPIHTQLSSVQNQHIVSVAFQKDPAPLWVFK